MTVFVEGRHWLGHNQGHNSDDQPASRVSSTVPTCSAMMKDGARALLALVPERQARLTKILKDAFGDKPKLTAIPGGRA